jgi:coproporphyrinogen III oxidase-like Fe-S oxidoreductase
MEPYVAALVPQAVAAYAGAVEATNAPASHLPPGGFEVLTAEAAAAEELILSLRLDTGLSEAAAAQPPLSGVVDWAESVELLERVAADGSTRIRLTTRGRLLSNELFSRLL